MTVDRRDFLMGSAATAALWTTAPRSEARIAKATGLRLIGVEEHFSIPEIVGAMRAAHRTFSDDLDIQNLYAVPASDLEMTEQGLVDFERKRLADMDRTGVSMQILSLTAPGVQVFAPDTAVEFARLANDRVAEIVKRHPERFAALTALAPQDTARAVAEMQRGIQQLQFNGFIINSHTHNEYLDVPKFWPILEAAEALDRPIYIHPRAPSVGMAAPMTDYNLSGALWGFGMEAGTHAVRLMISGALDRFPKLKIVLGHMGEAVPFWLARLDTNAAPGSDSRQKNQMLPSEYFRRNFWIATTGVLDPLALQYCIQKIGADRILWSTDYPYAPAAPAAAFIAKAPISDTERQQIAHGNAERLFHLNG
ncbi:MAG TPA: amidohydrolase family protein [Steroidobacteraceae bacterium]|nr:amidohydrolase family protein [Steroidobacteraceae bacterium]